MTTVQQIKKKTLIFLPLPKDTRNRRKERRMERDREVGRAHIHVPRSAPFRLLLKGLGKRLHAIHHNYVEYSSMFNTDQY